MFSRVRLSGNPKREIKGGDGEDDWYKFTIYL